MQTLDYGRPPEPVPFLDRVPWRTLFRYAEWCLAVLLAAVIVAALGLWAWCAGRDAYQARRVRAFTMPADRVVYEEDPARAEQLLALPRSPETAYVGSPLRSLRLDGIGDGDYRGDSLGSTRVAKPRYAEYVPEFWTSLFRGWAGTLAFVHERSSSSGPRLVLAVAGPHLGAAPGATRTEKDGLVIGANARPLDRLFEEKPRYFQRIRIPLRPEQVARVYAGQVDPANAARFTITYEVDDVPGTVEGVLQPDGSVTLRVLDGPGVGNWGPIR